MSKADEHRIEDVETLRETVGEGNPAVATKLLESLDDFARAFIARSPFIVVSTADGRGRLDSSP